MLPALVLIDFQTGFDADFWGARNNPEAEDRAAQLLSAWRERGGPVCHVLHLSKVIGSPLHPDSGGCAFKPQVAPLTGEPVFEKSTNSAFVDTALEAHLIYLGATELVICGLTTPHCVSTNVRWADNLGYNVTLAHDACASFSFSADTGWSQDLSPMEPELIHDTAVSHLHGEFCMARTVAAIFRDLP